MLYEINLSQMEFYARHGCYELERTVGNRFEVNLSLKVEMGSAADDDDVAQTVNYLEVYRCVARQMSVEQRTPHTAGNSSMRAEMIFVATRSSVRCSTAICRATQRYASR